MSKEESLWSEYKNSEGRVYWSHAVTKQSVWEKPDELKTPFEKAIIAKTEWKQYTSKGRPYYVHSATRETSWDLPPELAALEKRVEAEEKYKEERERRRALGMDSPTPPPRSPSPELALIQREPSPEPIPLRVISMPPGGFVTHEKAVEGFEYLLKREGVNETWTWDQTMRKIIMDPLYKALDTLAQKKKVFEDYLASLVEEKQAKKDARMARFRPAFQKLFTNNPQIQSYSTLKTANKAFKHDRTWREALEEERRILLEEYTSFLAKKEATATEELRERNVATLASLVKELDITVTTPWRAAHNIILSSDAFRGDKGLQNVETVDILNAYDERQRVLYDIYEEEARRYRLAETRRARKARDGFKALLKELEAKGELTRSSKWKNTVPKIRDDPRYQELLGVAGSSPVDLWMDAVDDLSEEIIAAADKIEKALKGPMTLDTTEEAFEDLVKEAHLDTQVDAKLRKEAFGLIHERLVTAAADEARRAERKRRHRMEDLRYALKKVQRHIDVDMTYDEALPHIRDLPEFKDITQEEDRKSAFDKFIKRQKEKLREAESSDVASNSARSHGRRGSTNKMDVDEKDRKPSRRDRSSDRDRRERERDRHDRYDKRDDRYKSDKYDDKYRDSRRDSRRHRSSVEPDDRDKKRPRHDSRERERRKAGSVEVEEGEI